MNAGKVDIFFKRVELFTIGSYGQKVSEKTKTDTNCWTPGNQSKAYPSLSDLLHSFSWGAVQSSATDLEK